RDSRQRAMVAAELDRILARRHRNERLGPLLAVQGLVHLIRALRLIPEDVARMARLLVERDGVTIEDRTAKRPVRDGVPGSADRSVAAGHHPLELVSVGIAEARDVVRAQPAAVVLHLLHEL